MKKRLTMALAAGALVAAMAPGLVSAEPADLVMGSGSVAFTDGIWPGESFTFELEALPKERTGTYSVSQINGTRSWVVTIDCLSVSGDVAFFGGEVTASAGGGPPLGADITAAVRDGGEGRAAASDRLFLGLFGIGACYSSAGQAYATASLNTDGASAEVKGNVQVKDR